MKTRYAHTDEKTSILGVTFGVPPGFVVVKVHESVTPDEARELAKRIVEGADAVDAAIANSV